MKTVSQKEKSVWLLIFYGVLMIAGSLTLAAIILGVQSLPS